MAEPITAIPNAVGDEPRTIASDHFIDLVLPVSYDALNNRFYLQGVTADGFAIQAASPQDIRPSRDV